MTDKKLFFTRQPHCPFYGRSALVPLRMLPRSERTNRCALITTAETPCVMEVVQHTAPDWPTCPLQAQPGPAALAARIHSENAEHAAQNIWNGYDPPPPILEP